MNKLNFLLVFFLAISNVYARDNFLVMESIHYKNKPDLSEYGIYSIPVVYAGELFLEGADRSQMPAISKMRSAVKNLSGFNYKKKFLVLDIESWPIYKADSRIAMESVDKYSNTVMIFRKLYARDDINIGYYSVGPVRDYWRAIKSEDSQEYKKWMAENSVLLPLMKHVDVLYPSLYTFYDDINGWKQYATANIREAKRLAQGKPVICFIWPRYHDSNKLLSGKFIPGDYWRAQLELIYDNADGVIIWDGSRDDWDERLEWIKVTKDFIKRINSTSTF